MGTEGIPAGGGFGDHWAMAAILGSNLGDLIRAGIPTLVRRTRGRSPWALVRQLRQSMMESQRHWHQRRCLAEISLMGGR